MDIDRIRHSTAHVLAQAVRGLFPGVKLGIGPVIENGFYYDFDNIEVTEEDIPKIEERMNKIINEKQVFKKAKKNRKESQKILKGQKYKLELLKELKDNEITFYQNGDFIDLCKGPHVNSTGEIKAFKITHLAGAYWKGDSSNKMLTRVYGVAFQTPKELKKYLVMREEAEKRNHIKLGRELEIFMISEIAGKGLPLWLPKGNIIKEEIEQLAKETEKTHGYVRVTTPHLAKKELFEKSGHLPYYADSMYPEMKMDDGSYYLKAMNCPHHHLIYNHKLRSYRELPLRIAEYGTCYRNELSGTLAGLLRVRMLNMNDAHIYCTKDQIEKEIESLIKMVEKYYKLFGLKDYWYRLSKGDSRNKKKYIDEPENWRVSEKAIRNVLKKLKVKFEEVEDEAAFYGPKIDIQFTAVSGREESMSTIQLDFAAKSRFNLKYQDQNGKENNEVFVIHRAPLSVHERFMAFLIEQYAGHFPLWLAPEQIRIVTITDKNVKYAKELAKELKSYNIRVEVDDRSERIPKKVRDAQVDKIPILVTVGDKEVSNKTVAIRTSDGKVKFGLNKNKFIEKIIKIRDDRSLKINL